MRISLKATEERPFKVTWDEHGQQSFHSRHDAIAFAHARGGEFQDETPAWCRMNLPPASAGTGLTDYGLLRLNETLYG